MTRTVRDAAFDVLRQYDLTTIFANPGSTEVSLLTNLPDDLTFVLALHEGSVVGAATGYALGRERPALAILHTTAGLGNAIGAIATARVNRAPVVIIVGQQDRRHLALEPFLAGRLAGLAGDYPVWVDQPVRAQDVPGSIARAYHEAMHARGPALVIVPMDDWLAPADDLPLPAPARVVRPAAVSDVDVAELVALLEASSSPALVVGAGADDPRTWQAIADLANTLDCPVYQESFGARAGFAQDHPRFAGFLPADRPRLREMLAAFDTVLTIGAPVFRQYPYTDGPLVNPGTTLAVVTREAEEAHRSPVDLAVIGEPAPIVEALVEVLPSRTGGVLIERTVPNFPSHDGPMRAAHVLSEVGERISADTVVIEESPSSRPDIHALLPARSNLGFLSAAMGGLGFAMPAAIGIRMALPQRPVLAIVGDGSSLYNIQSLWTAAHYGVGVVFLVMSNGRYAIMDRLAERIDNGKPPWPAFEEVSVSKLADAFGCAHRRVNTIEELRVVLDEIVPSMHQRTEPLLLDVAVIPDTVFQP